MRIFPGFQHGVNLGGWLSQCVATTDIHFDTFIGETDIERIAAMAQLSRWLKRLLSLRMK